MSYVYMKVLESAPDRYDRGMRILTLGRLDAVHQAIADSLASDSSVLDIGCGTGALAVRLARKGMQVTGIDVSARMLDQAARRVQADGLAGRVALKELGAVDLDTAFPDGCFDAAVSTLVFSELSDDEIKYTLVQCRRILRPGGELLIADEVLPESALGRITTSLIRLPFAAIAFLLTQNGTHRVSGLGERIKEAGFRLIRSERFIAGTLGLFVGQAPSAAKREMGRCVADPAQVPGGEPMIGAA